MSSPQDETTIIDDSTSSSHLDSDGTTATTSKYAPQASDSNTDEEGVNGTLETIAGLMGK